jgi:hypothetical protein
MASEKDLLALRAELSELVARMSVLSAAIEREQQLLAVLDKEFPVEPSWASGSKSSIRATIASLEADKQKANVRGVVINAHLPVALPRDTEQATFRLRNG